MKKPGIGSQIGVIWACALTWRLFMASCARAAVIGDFPPETNPIKEALPAQQPNTWVKRSIGPRLGYEAAMAWDTWHHRLIRLKPHNLAGGCQQNELWTCDPVADKWELRGPDLEPPGNCRQPQHVFDPERVRCIRFLQAREEGDAVRLKWEAAPGPGVRGCRVWRLNGAVNKKIAPVLLTEAPIAKTEFTDPSGGVARRYVLAVDTLGQEAYPSNAVWGHQPQKHKFYSRYETWGAHGAEGAPALRFGF